MKRLIAMALCVLATGCADSSSEGGVATCEPVDASAQPFYMACQVSGDCLDIPMTCDGKLGCNGGVCACEVGAPVLPKPPACVPSTPCAGYAVDAEDRPAPSIGVCDADGVCCTACLQGNGLCKPFSKPTCGAHGNQCTICEPSQACIDGVCK